jgi:DNA helicase-2/ATP-dependent DNA helicase PcrA
MNLTDEQNAIIEAARETRDNLAIIARAGCGKTYTLTQIAEALPREDVLCIAFNKAIAEEMRARLPENCEAKTLHAIGYKAWWGFIRRKTSVSGGKIYSIMSEIIKSYEDELDADEMREIWEDFSDMMRAVSSGKMAGWLPEQFEGHWRPLVGDIEFFESLEREYSPLQQDIIKTTSVESFKSALHEGRLDFDDMIFCPAICAVQWPSPSLTLVDEAQDLAPINHHIIRKIVRRSRIIAVGDNFQAIYGFRGADVRSMQRMIDIFSMRKLPLTLTFRCPAEIVRNVHWRADDMRWSRDGGTVLRPITWRPEDLRLGDAIICRNNAPLFRMAIRLITAGLLPEIAGRDIGAPLVKIMEKLSRNKKIVNKESHRLLLEWRDKQLSRARNGAAQSIHDRYECISIMLDQTDTLGDAIAYLQHLLARDGRIRLMTGHKAKGLEFPRVFFLDQQLCNPKYEQDLNLRYVVETRAQDTLIYVTSDSFITDEPTDHND